MEIVVLIFLVVAALAGWYVRGAWERATGDGDERRHMRELSDMAKKANEAALGEIEANRNLREYMYNDPNSPLPLHERYALECQRNQELEDQLAQLSRHAIPAVVEAAPRTKRRYTRRKLSSDSLEGNGSEGA
jgi:hypothetical protein